MRHSVIPSTYILFVRDETDILLQRRLNTGYEDGNYGIPSGHVERGESPSQAALREAIEEVGVTIAPVDLSMAHIMYRFNLSNGEDRVCFFHRAALWQGVPENKEVNKCDDLRWFPLNNLPKNTIEHVRAAIEYIRKGVFYSEGH
jgi:8-oxo-dGTP pyrophosphatase MutT (NUDIX family)